MKRTSPAETLAEILGVERPYVMAQARAHKWPHVRVGRSVRFTDEQIEQIIALCTIAPSAEQQQANEWGQKTRRSA